MSKTIGPDERRERAMTSAEGILGLVATGRLGETEPWVAYGAIDDVVAEPEVASRAFPGLDRAALREMYETAYSDAAWAKASSSGFRANRDREVAALQGLSRRSGVPVDEIERLRSTNTADLHDAELRAMLNRV